MSIIDRRIGEDDVSYHKRLLYGKLVDRTLSDVDYTELSSKLYGQSYSSDVARRMAYGSLRTLKLIEQSGDRRSAADAGEIDDKIRELRRERQKLFDERASYNKIVREQARWEELKEIVERTVLEAASLSDGDDNFDDDNQIRAASVSGKDLLVSLNDIHYGAVVDNHWRKYSSDICARMFDEYAGKVENIQRAHGAENCVVFANGDLISGNIHHSIAVSNKENVIEQVVGVSELISSFLVRLSRIFNEVRFVSVSGNHSRLNPSKEMSIPSERLDDLVEWYLAAKLSQYKNIIIGYGEKIDETMYVIDIRGKKYVGVHGDYDTSNSNIQAIQSMVREPIYSVLMGHLHHNSIETVNGVKAVMAGSFLGTDSFCVSKRIFGEPEQLVLVCGDDGIECFYDIHFEK